MSLAEVKIYGQTAGYISWDKKTRQASYEFEEDCKLPFAPIHSKKGLRIITGIKSDTYRGLPSFIADSLPDAWGNTVIDKWLQQEKINKKDFTAVDRLNYLANRGMGAFEYLPSKGTSAPSNKRISIDQLIDVAEVALGNKEKFTTSLDQISEVMQVSSSAGGARAKAVVGINWKTNEIRSGISKLSKGFEHYLLKLDGGGKEGQWHSPEQYGRTEYAYYKMALKAGIDMQECKLLIDGDRRHFCTKRFDRINGSEKVHMLTACGMFEMDFNKQQEYSYESIIDHMRGLDFKQADLNQVVRRAVFNVLSCNHDDHTKNFSFLMDKEGTWSLSPAYDLTYIHTDGWNFAQQITINDEYEDITLNDIKALAAHAGCNNIGDIVDQVREATSSFKTYAEEAEVSTKRSNKIEKAIEDIAKNI